MVFSKPINSFLSLLLLAPLISWSQETSVFGRMQVDYSRGCAPFTINIAEVDSLSDISRTYTYETGGMSTSDTFFTYQDPGVYQIVQLLGEDIVPKTDTLVIEVLANPKPQFDILICDADRAVLQLDSVPYAFYDIEANLERFVSDASTEFSQLITYRDTLQLSLRGGYTNASQNCQVLDTILMRSTAGAIANLELDFDFICTDLVTAQIEFEGAVDQLYRLSLTNNEGRTFRTIETTWEAGSIVIDSLNIPEGIQEVCLQLEAISACDESVFDFRELCQSTSTITTPFDYLFASFTGDSIAFSMAPIEDQQITLSRLVNDEKQFITEILDSITFLSEVFSQQPIFILDYSNACLNDSLSYQVAPPFLTTNRLGINHYEVSYSSSQFFHIDADLSSDQGYLFGESDTILIISPLEDIRLRLENGAIQNLLWLEEVGSYTLSSNSRELSYEYYVHIPSAFTPNNDGINDQLQLFGLPTERFQLKVFNRWGEKVFETDQVNNLWDGRLSNGNILEGTYVYRLNFYNSLGELFTQQGSFAVIQE